MQDGGCEIKAMERKREARGIYLDKRRDKRSAILKWFAGTPVFRPRQRWTPRRAQFVACTREWRVTNHSRVTSFLFGYPRLFPFSGPSAPSATRTRLQINWEWNANARGKRFENDVDGRGLGALIMNNECRDGGGARLETADTRGFSNDNPPRRRFILRVDTYRIWNFPTRGIDRLENRHCIVR